MFYKCEQCGGSMIPDKKSRKMVCQSCNSVRPLFLSEEERYIRNYNRANRLRISRDYEGALEIYSNLIAEYTCGTEVYWQMVLCKYGVEYVEDGRSGRQVPNCTRANEMSIYKDPDYMEVVKRSKNDPIYKELAEEINNMQQTLLLFASKQKPVQVFICYKEDEISARSEDNMMARELYDQLKEKGIRAFYAKESLNPQIPSESVIFSAIRTAKVMVVLGSKREFFESTQIRNQWCRFKRLMENSSGKVIVPAYFHMGKKELPEELQSMSGINLDEAGAVAHLVKQIDQYVNRIPAKEENKKEQAAGVLPADRLIRNADTYLMLKNYKKAISEYNRVTEYYTDDYRGWWGLIVSNSKNFQDVPTGCVAGRIMDAYNTWFIYARKLAPDKESFREKEEQYLEFIRQISVNMAAEDMQQVNRVISRSGVSKEPVQEQLAIVKEEKEQLTKAYEEMKSEIEGDVRRAELMITKSKNLISAINRKTIISTIMILVGVIGFGLLNFRSLNLISTVISLGISVCGLLFMFSIPRDKPKHYAKMKEQENIRKENMIKMQLVSENYNEKIAQIDKRIQDMEKNVRQCENSLRECRTYLNQGIEKIASYFYKKNCQQIQVNVACDPYIESKRKAAYKFVV